jgi:hypothetical protein
MAVAVLVGGLTGLTAQAVFSGAGTVAVYHREGTNPPVTGYGGKYTSQLTCKCGTADVHVATAYSNISQEDADNWAKSACFDYCRNTNPPKGGVPPPSGTWRPTSTTSDKHPGTLLALSPEHFAAYLPGSETPVAESADAQGLALKLMYLTDAPVVMLAGPIEYFEAAKPVCE